MTKHVFKQVRVAGSAEYDFPVDSVLIGEPKVTVESSTVAGALEPIERQVVMVNIIAPVDSPLVKRNVYVIALGAEVPSEALDASRVGVVDVMGNNEVTRPHAILIEPQVHALQRKPAFGR
jgi:hypothetical protein